jgi:hypothetical protein
MRPFPDIFGPRRNRIRENWRQARSGFWSFAFPQGTPSTMRGVTVPLAFTRAVSNLHVCCKKTQTRYRTTVRGTFCAYPHALERFEIDRTRRRALRKNFVIKQLTRDAVGFHDMCRRFHSWQTLTRRRPAARPTAAIRKAGRPRQVHNDLPRHHSAHCARRLTPCSWSSRILPIRFADIAHHLWPEFWRAQSHRKY